MSTKISGHNYKENNIFFMHMKIASIKSQVLQTDNIENCFKQIVSANDFIDSIFIKDSIGNIIPPVIVSPYLSQDDFLFSPAAENFRDAMQDYFSKLKTGVLEYSITEPSESPFTEKNCYTISCKLNNKYILCINIEDFSDSINPNLKAV